MNHSKRNRNKARLHRKKQQRSGAIIKYLRDKLEEQRLTSVKCYEEKTLLQWKYNSLKDQVRQQEQRRINQRAEPGAPPRPYKYWYEVFLAAKNDIYRMDIDSPMFVLLEPSHRVDYRASDVAHGVHIPVENILFGTLRELINCVLPRDLFEVVRERLFSDDNMLRGITKLEGRQVKYKGLSVDIQMLERLSYMRERDRDLNP